MIVDAFGDLNWIAVVVSAFVAFGIGLAWFAPRSLGTLWVRQVTRYTGIPPEQITAAAGQRPALVSWLAAIAINAMVLALAIELSGTGSAWDGAFIGIVLGVGMGATLNSWPLIFARMPRPWWMLNNGAFLVMQAAMGSILGAWR